jgi:preprotein translocase subunit SecF
MLLKLIPNDTKINFVKYRGLYFAISLFMLIAAGVSYGIQGLNYGIDFAGGILVEVRAVDDKGQAKPADVGAMRQTLGGIDLGEVSLQSFGQPSDVLIRVERQTGDEAAQMAAIQRIRDALGKGYEIRRQEFVGPTVGAELIRDGAIATILALLAIMAYVWFRFEWQFGVAAVVALAHDVFLTIGLFSELGLEFNLATVAAVLTIAGYSINDTVVVFDRVRENMRRYKKMPMPDLMNRSLNDTLSRTLMTSLTTMLALVALYFFGGPVIRDFSFAMIWGIIIGTYSSICLAVPLLLFMNIKRGARELGDAEEVAEGTPAKG